jgi:hypothetical protein
MASVTNVSAESVDCPLLGVGAIAPGASVQVDDALIAYLSSSVLKVVKAKLVAVKVEGNQSGAEQV